MSYTINKTNGSVLTTVADGTLDNTTSITLIGKNYPGYGAILNSNFIRLLENSANTTAPLSPIAGQLWWDSTNSLLKVYTGAGFKNIGGSTSATSAPSSPVTGDLWWDANSTIQQLKVYNGATWTVIGPPSTQAQGTSGAIVESWTDSASVSHTVVVLYAGNKAVAVINKDQGSQSGNSWQPSPAKDGFPLVYAGITLCSQGSLTGAQFTGLASNADTLDGLNNTDFMKATNGGNGAVTGTGTTLSVAVNNNSGLTVGQNADAKISINSSNVLIDNQNSAGTISLRTRTAGGVVNTALVIQNTGDITPGANVSYNLGSASFQWNNIYGKASQAAYADLAERYESDAVIAPGTVVSLGGDKEVTTAMIGDDVFGVVSTAPAYLMNGTAGSDETHPPIALVGRVPVRAVGQISKGDKVVVGGAGVVVRYVPDPVVDPDNPPSPLSQDQLVGRALADKYTDEEGLIEVVLAAH